MTNDRLGSDPGLDVYIQYKLPPANSVSFQSKDKGQADDFEVYILVDIRLCDSLIFILKCFDRAVIYPHYCPLDTPSVFGLQVSRLCH